MVVARCSADNDCIWLGLAGLGGACPCRERPARPVALDKLPPDFPREVRHGHGHGAAARGLDDAPRSIVSLGASLSPSPTASRTASRNPGHAATPARMAPRRVLRTSARYAGVCTGCTVCTVALGRGHAARETASAPVPASQGWCCGRHTSVDSVLSSEVLSNHCQYLVVDCLDVTSCTI